MNETINDGGPAFPVPGFTDDPGNAARTYHPEPGMSLRAWLAGQALAGVTANGDSDITWSVENIATYCVTCADKVINELDKP